MGKHLDLCFREVLLHKVPTYHRHHYNHKNFSTWKSHEFGEFHSHLWFDFISGADFFKQSLFSLQQSSRDGLKFHNCRWSVRCCGWSDFRRWWPAIHSTSTMSLCHMSLKKCTVDERLGTVWALSHIHSTQLRHVTAKIIHSGFTI